MNGQPIEKVTEEQMISVSGGKRDRIKSASGAYCKACKKQVDDMTDGTYKCFNSECPEFDKSKKPWEVDWK